MTVAQFLGLETADEGGGMAFHVEQIAQLGAQLVGPGAPVVRLVISLHRHGTVRRQDRLVVGVAGG
jgi:hypothetical protein